MNKNVAFTIVAKNYIGLAKILEESLIHKNNDTDFFIIVADEFPENYDFESLPSNVLIAKNILNISNRDWLDMSFKYDLTEFCTSIKPASFLYFIENSKYQKILYFDPDIFIFNSLISIYDILETYSILLTPHISTIQEKFNGDLHESNILGSGVFNLGFCGIKRSDVSIKMLIWWNSRLKNKCFIDSYNFYFTDQKWMDFLPCYFNDNDLCISRDLGLNIAPWNYFERKVYLEGDQLMVCNREEYINKNISKVIFVHFSGYNYNELKCGRIIQNNISSLKNFKDIEILLNTYTNAIIEKRDLFDTYINETYTYSNFENGVSITKLHRRLYRSLVDNNYDFFNPFSTDYKTFYRLIYSKGMINRSFQNKIKINRNNLQGVEGKLKVFNFITRLLYKIIGVEKYTELVRLLGAFGRFEAQIHLISRSFDKENIKTNKY